MIQVYIDESGTHDQATIIVMAGFLSSSDHWRKFEMDWNAVLNPASELGASPQHRVFHATDCLGTNGYKDFAGWSKEERNALVEKLISVVRNYPLLSFASAFALEDYNAVVPKWIRDKWKHPYYLSMFHSVNLLKVNRQELSLPVNERFAFVFGHKPGFVGLLRELYNELLATEAVGDILGEMTHGTPSQDVPIQAADLLCYLVRTFWEKEHFQHDTASPRTLRLLRGLGPILNSHFLDRTALEEFVRIYEETHQKLGD